MDLKFLPPDRKTVANLLRLEYDKRFVDIKEIFESLDSKVCFVTDEWAND